MASSTGQGEGRWGTGASGVRLALMIAGGLGGVAAAMGAYRAGASVWLAGFAFVMTYYTIGYALGRVIGQPHKRARVGLFVLLPVAGSAILAVVALSGGPPWLAVALALIGGDLVQGLLGPALFRPIAAEERITDPIRRWLRPETWDQPGPHDVVPPWMRHDDRPK